MVSLFFVVGPEEGDGHGDLGGEDVPGDAFVDVAQIAIGVLVLALVGGVEVIGYVGVPGAIERNGL